MKQNYFTLVSQRIIEAALQGPTAGKLLDIVSTALRDEEKKVFNAFFGINGPRQDLEAIARASGIAEDKAETILNRLMLKLRKHPEADEIWFSVNARVIAEDTNREVGRKWNTKKGSALYFMRGRFYVNRNPYGPDREAPASGIPFDHRNEVMLMNMSDFHTTAVVLGQGERRGVFAFESSWGMQGFRYVGDSTAEPFPYDEVRFCDTQSDAGYHVGYFAYRIGEAWGIFRLGDATCPYRRHDNVPLGEPTLEAAIGKLCKYSKFNPDWVWEKV